MVAFATPVISPYDAVIFDFDGTLVDTMPLHYEAYRRTFAEIDIELAPADYYDHVGGAARETIPRFLRGRPSRWSVTQIHARKQEHADALLRTQDVPRLATSALLPLLHGRVPMAIASSGSRPAIELVLERLGWTAYFEAVVTGADVPHGKPAPDLFLAAAARLAVPPARCLAFEDTDDGVESARRAEMAVVDVRDAIAPSAAMIGRRRGPA